MVAQYLYKILDESPPSPMPTTLPATDLDTHDGFIHLSTAAQTPVTAKLFFSNHTTLWILKLDRQALDGRLELSTDPKAGVENGCAHVHDSVNGLGNSNVLDVIEARRASDESWTDVQEMKSLTDS